MFGTFTVYILTASVVGVTLLLYCPDLVSGFRSPKEKNKQFSPVILIPGDGGSQLEAKLDKPKTVHMFCDQKTEGYFSLWLNPGLLFPGAVDCWVDNMRLYYNKTTRLTQNSPGVHIRVPGFGDTSSVEWLDPSATMPPFIARFILSAYFVDIADMLVKEGYTRGKNIRGAPYDFRKAPNELQSYFDSVKHLVEETYENNAEAKVTLICHSMGCPITNYFLNQQSQPWKDKYIKTLISLAGAWGGAVKALKTIASGENLGIIVVSQSALRTEQRTSPSLAYMLPTSKLWSKKDPIVITRERNYTVEDYYDFFRDIDYLTAYEMFKDNYENAMKSLEAPGVDVHCIHGTNLETPEKLDYRNSDTVPDDPPDIINGKGDGTVNAASLSACLQWDYQQKKHVYYLPIPGMEHMKILHDKGVIEYIRRVVTLW
ncbi:lysosomal phospholipase A and acyltransferase isoform X1 [Parasteatoda tepidariorum]|uniref:lysosomal phospholipase A and acyltransferase isoform X1 n=1 Tax=Parasteatoda tepidariorum TaxID=114398 RepID=UPI00077FC0C2|nr:phospholipase A2 group XV isoform X1 [Parasteatoda tepidariorum]